MSNLKCINEKCAGEVQISTYSMKIVDGKTVYVDRYGKPILCPVCSSGVETQKKFTGVPILAKFSNLSKEEKVRALKERSAKHSRRTRDTRDN